MRYLYIFPHPDDESFGPIRAMHKQLRQGHDVFLLTLTKGGATKVRFELNKSIQEMGEVRHQEMKCVEQMAELTGMTVMDLPDSGLKELDPRQIEEVIRKHIEKIKPEILVSYPVYGVSGFDDHLVTHAVVKRVYLEMKDRGADYLKRLAFFTLGEADTRDTKNPFNITASKAEYIDAVIDVSEEDIEMMKKCLECYKTYADVIARTGVKEDISDKVYFEIFGEDYKPPLKDLTEKI